MTEGIFGGGCPMITIKGGRGTPQYLQVVLPVHGQAVAEQVPHDQQVRVLAVHAHPVHAQEARQQRLPVALHHVLGMGRGHR